MREQFVALPLCWALLACALPAAASVTVVEDRHAGQPADLFDFWIGDWDVSWTQPDGTPGKGRNQIAKILDGAAIEERFEEAPTQPGPPLKGRSLSIRQQADGKWRQTWVDNLGSYLAFTAQVDGERRIFITDMASKGSQRIAQRMVFHSIQADALTWDWEKTTDGGKTWQLLWRIQYRRRPA